MSTDRWFVLRFKRAVRFPRFSMAAGELWSFRQNVSVANGLTGHGDRFPFAGGECLVADVEIREVGSRNEALLITDGECTCKGFWAYGHCIHSRAMGSVAA